MECAGLGAVVLFGAWVSTRFALQDSHDRERRRVLIALRPTLLSRLHQLGRRAQEHLGLRSSLLRG